MRSTLVTSLAISLLAGATQTAAWTARVGDFFQVEPINGDQGCVPAAKVFNGNEAEGKITLHQNIDGCPAPDLRFCNRWGGCPRTFNFLSVNAPFAITVQGDNGDGTIRVQGAALNGGSQVVNCRKDPRDEAVNGDQFR
ncbi:hypothetical protein TARUN_10406, partial [Trichoderma arundinaceum]